MNEKFKFSYSTDDDSRRIQFKEEYLDGAHVDEVGELFFDFMCSCGFEKEAIIKYFSSEEY